ncbi:bifunctional adenosylcobinamide kinase/adenosylcobinamide-phosphate guanylyltransferase [Rossellomorea sp. AcN35-11]|nr:bifunctional adenosylcobinamide kinase/adenosylcobinamide-phosphate guanylyltransferase [Rossellomorea aquimaris]WJV28482.1 bifunctional adenosylcobinamide kinase/adenosylcobinamide-phosphate guanylyltransferase [Rossellomorea sp. AcN35-11]
MGTLYFISGGVRSGKSSFAENWAIKQKKKRRSLIYLACGVNTDPEMKQRIIKHQQDRKESGGEWLTIECPESIENIIALIPRQSVVLLDCLTTLLTNEIYVNGNQTVQEIEDKIYQSILHLQNRVDVLLLVSNELVYDLPMDSSTLLFQKHLGSLHRRLVCIASVAIEMTSGIPVVKKVTSSEGVGIPCC